MEIPMDMGISEFNELVLNPQIEMHPLGQHCEDARDILIIDNSMGPDYSADVYIVRQYMDRENAEVILRIDHHQDYDFDPKKLGRTIYRKTIVSRKANVH